MAAGIVMRLGDHASLTRVFTPADLADCAALGGWVSGDTVPDPLVAGLFSCLLGTRLPGPGTGWLKQSLRHHAPARLGEPLTARVEITRLRPDKSLADLACTCRDGRGGLVCDGRALMLLGPRVDRGRPDRASAAQNMQARR